MIHTILLVLNLFILEALLSVDNAAVLAVLVKGLPMDDSKKALRYGIWGAYILRGACLFIASWLVSLWYLKVLGGLYLIYLAIGHFSKSADTAGEDLIKGEESRIYQFFKRNLGLSQLWLTIILVEIMDLIFSIDNIFASVAMTSNYWLIILGVFMGIAAMRWVATWFVGILRKYPSLETSAFIVIGLLGLKLVIAGVASGVGLLSISTIISARGFDLAFSGVMMLIFIIPILLGRQYTGPILDLADSVDDVLHNHIE